MCEIPAAPLNGWLQGAAEAPGASAANTTKPLVDGGYMNACIGSRDLKHLVAFFGSLGLLLVFLVPFAAAQGTSTFKGEIADDQLNCVQTPMKVSQDIKDKTSCVLYYAHFVKPGSKYVLYDPATKTKYQLDDQDLVQPYVGAKQVQITGSLDAATKTIHVKEIKALS
jgi:hypothetical protein